MPHVRLHHFVGHMLSCLHDLFCVAHPLHSHQGGEGTVTFCLQILLPSARHLEEGRGTTILELLKRENCKSRLCPRPLGSHPPPNTQIG